MANVTATPCPTVVGAWCQELDAGATLNSVAVALDGQGDVVLVGRDRTGMSEDVLVAKYTPDGQLVWARHFATGPLDTDYASDVAIDGQDNILISGQVYAFGDDSGLSYPFVAKVSSAGELRWFEQPADGLGRADVIAVDAHGDAITGDLDGNMFKYSAAGDLLWTQAAPVAQEPTGIVVDAGGNIFVAGHADVGYLTELAPNGEAIWRTPFGSGSVYPAGLALDSSGDLLLSGLNGNETLLARYSPEGNVVWSEDVDSDFANPSGVAVDGSGTIWLVGWGRAQSGAGNSVTLASYAPDGTRLQSQSLSPPRGAIFLAFVADAAGNVFIAGGDGQGIILLRASAVN